MVTVFKELRKFLFLKGWIKDVVLPGKFLVGKPCLKEAAGGSPLQIATDKRIAGVHGKCLLRQKHIAARPLLQPPEDFQIVYQPLFLHHIGRCGYFSQPVRPVAERPHQSTSSGLKLSCHGSPHLFRASMNGSGSNSSMLYTPGFFQVPFITSMAPIMAGTPVV